jgi:hypothetical protein
MCKQYNRRSVNVSAQWPILFLSTQPIRWSFAWYRREFRVISQLKEARACARKNHTVG